MPLQLTEQTRQQIAQARNICDSEPERAKTLAQQALVILEDFPDATREKANAYYALGIADYRLDNFKAAEAHLQQALKHFEQLDDQISLADTQNALANNFMATARYSEAMHAFTQSLSHYEHTNSPKEKIATVLNNLGNLYYYLADYPRAIEHHQHALRIREELGNKQSIAASLNNLGVVYAEMEDYQSASETFEQSLKLKQSFASPIALANTYINLGNAVKSMGRIEQAQMCYDNAKNLYQQAGKSAGVAIAIHALAKVHNHKGKHQEAKACLLESLKTFELLEMKREKILSMITLGKTYAKLQQGD